MGGSIAALAGKTGSPSGRHFELFPASNGRVKAVGRAISRRIFGCSALTTETGASNRRVASYAMRHFG